MEDETYAFIEDVKTRKDVARSAKNKKCGKKSKRVTFPSDYLTKKEREAMNGDCKTWSMFKFYTWEEFQEMPADIQGRYLNSIIDRYGVGLCTISKHQFKKSPSNLDKYLTAHGIKGVIKHTSPGTGPAVKKNLSRYLEAIEKQNRNETADSPQIVIDFKVEEPPEKPADIFIPDGMAPGYCSDGTKVEDSIKEIVHSKVIFGDEEEKKEATDELVKKAVADISKSGVTSMLINMDGFDLELIDYLYMQKFKNKKVKVTMTINVVED